MTTPAVKTQTTTENIFYAEIRELLQKSRGAAYQAVNTVMVNTYWQIGKRIVEQEQHGESRANYGDYLITNLSRYLSDTLGKGFSEANLWNMRQFYLVFPHFSTQRVENLTWTHIRLIMRLESPEERSYYIKEAAEQNWTSRLLERNIKSGYYRRLLSTQHQPAVTGAAGKYNPADFIKDPYIAEFLNVPEDLKGKESLLETALINNLQKFLLELGKGFSFVDRQMRISTET
jgi:predicted nuclease of restriction endonuclease-like (RecB) superfamily